MTPDSEQQYRLQRLEQDVQRLESRLDAYIKRDLFEVQLSGVREDIKDIRERAQRTFWTLVVAVIGVAGNLIVFFLTRGG